MTGGVTVSLDRLRHRDGVATVSALLTAMVMIAQQVAGKASRDALFLSHFDVTDLPKVVMLSALLSVIGVLVISRLLASQGPARLVPRLFALSAVFFAGEWWLFGRAPQAAVLALYLHMGVFGATLASGFWSVINERFDPHTAKRRIARIGAAAALGGILGGVIAGRVATADPRAMLLVLCGMHLLCVGGVRGIGSLQRIAPREPPARMSSGVHVLARNNYLLQMALLMTLAAVVAGLLDYALKAGASARFAAKPDLVTFFATFYAAVGAATFAVQVAVGPALLNRFGIGGTASVLPAAIAVGGLLAAVTGNFWGFVCLRAAEAVFANSLFRSGFEVLYTPLAPQEKRPTKTIIDVGGSRLGDMLGGTLLLILLFMVPKASPSLVVSIAAVVSALALLMVASLYQGYVSRLAANLRGGWLSLDAGAVSDATTRRIFAETTAIAERELLLARIRQLEGTQHADSTASIADARLAVIAGLTCGQTERIRRALGDSHLDVTMAPYLIPLLANPELTEEVRLELRWLAPRIVGQLTDALLDADLPVIARSRIPGVMEVVHNARVGDGLMQGLHDAEFSVRYSCARALLRMTGRSADLIIPPDRVFEIVQGELSVEDDVWRRQTHLGEHIIRRDTGEAPAAGNRRLIPSLQHVFTVLGLALDREALSLSLQAVLSDDPAARGTALEYLENVLPVEVRRNLWQRLGISERVEKSQRSRKELLARLRRSTTGPSPVPGDGPEL